MNSLFQQPPGALRTYASPRKYHLDLKTKTATEVWNYPLDETVNSPFCGSIYEDLPLNYLVDYAYVIEVSGQTIHARILGLDATGAKSSTTNMSRPDVWRLSTLCPCISKALPCRRSAHSRLTFPPAVW